MTAWKQFGARLLTAVYPNRCLFCGGLIAEDAFCCDACGEKLVRCRIEPKLYKVCPIPYCDGMCSVFRYNTVSKAAVFRLKFHRDKSVVIPMARLMSDAVRKTCLLADQTPREMFDCILPVPMHRKHVRKRGYNQSVLLAKRMAKELSVPCADKLLYKIRLTAKQHDISFHDRKVNLQGAFYAPNPQAVKGKRILLVDDICTSGSTFLQCGKTLVEAGAKSVYCAAFLSQSARNREAWHLQEWMQDGVPARFHKTAANDKS